MKKIIALVGIVASMSMSCKTVVKSGADQTAQQPQEDRVAIKSRPRPVTNGPMKAARIIPTKESPCSHMLEIVGESEQLDPVNLKEQFKTDSISNVWVSFASLRMPNQCLSARPVRIIRIKKRED